MNIIFAGIAGLLTGVLSSWGVGGGTLLIIYMTAAAGLEQQAAQGINLLYFIPASLAALFSHAKNKLIEKNAVIPAVLAGVPATLASALLASGMDSGVMKKIFGAFLILTGISEIFRKSGKTE